MLGLWGVLCIARMIIVTDPETNHLPDHLCFSIFSTLTGAHPCSSVVKSFVPLRKVQTMEEVSVVC